MYIVDSYILFYCLFLILVNVLICSVLFCYLCTSMLLLVLGNVSSYLLCVCTLTVHPGIVRNVFSIALYVYMCLQVIDNKADFDF